MPRSSLWDYSDTYILTSGNIKITGRPEDATPANKKTDKKVVFKICVPFIECTS